MTWRKWRDRAWLFARRAPHGCLFPLLALFTIVFVGTGLPEAIKAARGEGEAGTFVAERRECSPTRSWGETCSWEGGFRSADGFVSVDDVLLDTDTPRHVGDRLAVLYGGEADPPKVYLAEGSEDWLYGLFLVGGAAGYLAWGGWRLLRSHTGGGSRLTSDADDHGR